MFKSSLVIDTDIIIDLLRKVDDAKKFFKKIENNEFKAYYSTITELELFTGKTSQSTEEEKIIDDLLSLMIRVELDKNIARKAGLIRKKYDISIADSIIIATALAKNIKTIVTRNKKHFEKIKEVYILVPY